MSVEKVQTIQDWPEPHKVKDIQFFLGFTNFYHCFIDNYSDIVTPLTRLIHKGTPWNFSNSCHSTFRKLKDAFISAPILTHWIPDAPMIVETNASDYAIAGIFSIRCLDEEICPIMYYSWTLSTLELNYDTHDKELLAIHESFWTWWHYLEGSASLINVVTNHKNLKYFVMTKLLTRWQAQWSEFLFQFNMIVCFCPSWLDVKPDALTRHWDIYSKEGDKNYTHVNPHNFWPVFMQEQLAVSLQATCLVAPVLWASTLFNMENLHEDILFTLSSNPLAAIHMTKSEPPNSCWTIDSNSFLWLNGHMYIPDSNDLHLQVLWYKHDHPLSRHFGQNWMLKLIHHEYTWPGV